MFQLTQNISETPAMSYIVSLILPSKGDMWILDTASFQMIFIIFVVKETNNSLKTRGLGGGFTSLKSASMRFADWLLFWACLKQTTAKINAMPGLPAKQIINRPVSIATFHPLTYETGNSELIGICVIVRVSHMTTAQNRQGNSWS